MDYKKLNELDNIYPNTKSYKKGTSLLSLSDSMVLSGLYPEKNKINFKVPSISDLKWVADTEFRFILAIFKSYSDTSPVYYTSEAYYKDLQASLKENNPYLIQLSFLPSNIISYVVDDVLKTFESFHASEIKSFINMRQNIAFRSGSIVDYDNLVTYIDWVVSPISPLDEPNFGVLKPEMIAGWDQLVGNYSTGQLGEGVSGSFGIGSELVELANTPLKDAEAELARVKAELDKINKDISSIEEVIRTKNGFIYNQKSPSTVIINGITYQTEQPSAQFLLFGETNQSKANKLIKVLKDALTILYDRKKGLDNSLTSAVSGVSAAKGQSKPAINLTDVKNMLPPKIPKIPKIPDIPKIPKLPSLDSLGGAIVAALPAIPTIPKLSLPKLPSFKFPKLPKFKKKEPNEPKKFKIKKKAGLTELPKAPEVPKVPELSKVPTGTQLNSVSINGRIYTEGSPGYTQAKAEVDAVLAEARNRKPGDLLKELDKLPF